MKRGDSPVGTPAFGIYLLEAVKCTKYIRGVNLIASEDGAGIRKYYMYNGHGDVTQLTDTAGNVVKSYEYDAFGNEKNPDSNDANAFRYCGEYFDKETGTIYLRARYYNPAIGRFISEDSYWGSDNDPLSLNYYNYCNNSPITYVDPSGHIVCIVPLLAKAGAGGAADFMAQAAMNYFFNPNTQGDIGASMGAVNWWQVARSAAEGAIPWKVPGGRLGKAAATAVGDVLVNALNQGSDYSAEQALQDFAVGFIGDLAGGGLGDLISKYGAPAVASGLKKMGFSDSFISKMVCFTADTQILTKDGHKPIQDIKIGDEVFSSNTETGEKGLKKVRNIFVSEVDKFVHVYVGSEEIKATSSHPFWVVGKGWVEAVALEVGDKLLVYSGKVVEVDEIKQEQLAKPIRVYNFEVEDWHTYFVSNSNVLVHNSCAQPLIAPAKMQRHHIFPQSMRGWFSKRGISIDDYTIEITEGIHLRGVHGKGGFVGPGGEELLGKWNDRWKNFVEANPNATAKEVYQYAGSLLDEFGLNNLQIVPYK